MELTPDSHNPAAYVYDILHHVLKEKLDKSLQLIITDLALDYQNLGRLVCHHLSPHLKVTLRNSRTLKFQHSELHSQLQIGLSGESFAVKFEQLHPLGRLELIRLDPGIHLSLQSLDEIF